LRGESTGCQRGMSDNGLGVGMLVLSISVDGSILHQVPETMLAKTTRVTVKQIST